MSNDPTSAAPDKSVPPPLPLERDALPSLAVSPASQWRVICRKVGARLVMLTGSILNEALAVAVATASQVRRLFRYGATLAGLFFARRALSRAQLVLGEKMYQAGLGLLSLDEVNAISRELLANISAGRIGRYHWERHKDD